MSSLLRSSKYLKYFNSFNRSVSISSKPFEVLPVQSSSFLNFYSRNFASTVAQPDQKFTSIDRHIRRLDNDVRRSGRISFKEFQEVLDEMKIASRQTTSSQSLMVIRCCGNLIPEESPEVKLKLVNDIWDMLEQQGVPMDISHYNALLMVYLENENPFSPTEFLADLDKKGIEPNRVTFQRLIAAFCQHGNIDGATRILEFMKEKEMPISENIFNSLIIGHSQAKDMTSAKGILSVMNQANIEPTSDTYTALLCGYAKSGDMNGITDVFKLAESKEVLLQDRQLLEVIYHLAINEQSKLIDMIIPRLNRTPGYNQDAKNAILRLIVKGKDEAAMKVYKTMTSIQSTDEEPLSRGLFLLKQMIRMNRPYETIYQICQDLQDSKENERAIYSAAEFCLVNKKIEMGLKFISKISETDAVCQHYYWPALCHYGKNKNHEGIIQTLKQMSINMNQPIANETLREYVVEYLGPNEKGIMALRQAGVTVASAACAVVAHHLNNLDLENAARIASKYRANYNLVAVRRGIVQSYKVKPNPDNLIQMVRAVLSNLNNMENSETEDVAKGETDPAGYILIGIASSVRQGNTDHITQILKGYLEYGIGISNATASSLQEILSDNGLTPEISNLLSQLTSSDLSFVPLERVVALKSFSFQKNESSILEAINMAEAKEESTDSLKFQLMSLYCHQQEYDKATKILGELTDKGVTLPPDYLSQLFSICLMNENLEESVKYYNLIKKISPNYVLDELTVVKLATLYINADKFNEALSIIENHKLENYQDKEFTFTSSCWKLLNAIAGTGDAPKVEKMFNTLKTCNFITPTNVLLGPLVRVHLVNDDIKSALDKFEECCSVYRATPWKNEIACKLIQSEDAASLQRLTDLSSQVHGEVNSLYDLVLSFIECGRIRQARKILETPGLRTRRSRLSSACLRYQSEGHVNRLEDLVEVTKDLPHIDRADIYYHLLGSYCNANEVDKALGLWTQMQEEDIPPTDRFLIRLSSLLKKHNRPVPFSAPLTSTTDRLNSIEKKRLQETAEIRSFRKAIYTKDADQAMLLKQSIPDTELQLNDRSSLLTLLVNNGRLGEATKLLTQWLDLGLRPNIRALNYIINSVAKTGDINTLYNIGNMLDEDLKRLTSFTNRHTHCMVEAGKSEEALKELETALDNAKTPEQIELCRKTFPRGGVFSILSTSPELLPRFEKLVMRYKEKGIIEPLNILWVDYFIKKDKAKIDELWKDIKNEERLMYQPILKKANSTRDLELVQDLLNYCKTSNVNVGAIGSIHSVILDIFVLLDRVDECSIWLDDTLKTIPIEKINFRTLRRVKMAFENQGQLFKYTIPPKRKQSIASSSSDSDSDDEIRQKA